MYHENTRPRIGAQYADAPPIAWPSQSDLAHSLGIDVSSVSRDRFLKESRRVRIGREVKVHPDDAVRFLVSRGIPESVSRSAVTALVHKRLRKTSLFAGAEPETIARRSVFGSSDGGERARPVHLGSVTPTRPQVPASLRELHERFRGKTAPLETYVADERDIDS